MILLSFEVRATEGCPSALGDDPKILEFAKDNCEASTKLYKRCSENIVEPDKVLNLRKKNIQIAKEKKEELLSSKDYNDFYYKNFNYKNYFDQFFPNNDEVLNGKKIKPDYLFDWFVKDIGPNAPGVEKIEESFINHYVAFTKKNDCHPNIKSRSILIEVPGAKTSQYKKNEFFQKVKTEEFLAKKNEVFKKVTGENALEKSPMLICNPDKLQDKPLKPVAVAYEPCEALKVTNYFKDNSADLSSLLEDLPNDEQVKKFKACLDQEIKNGKTIHHISIKSSASALNNTHGYCPKAFKELSEDRANGAKDKILPELLPSHLLAQAGQDNLVLINARGSNGDGTSGECPYEMVNGKEVLKKGFRTEAEKASLNKNKFVTIQVTFNKSEEKIKGELEFEARYPCKEIYFECAPVK
jgi:hypothetical protein